ncbi:MAG: 2-oxoacid:ferredoxin oxidoreductase subunit beta [Euryarchaeota archaeon]|nr:2-oxoacid:ferredoxin oxidoreductase subunit beta [Euryarchaeota archaeon]
MPIWCPGCGDFSVLMALQKALQHRQVAPHKLAVISGIGCSSRIPHFINAYGFHMVHGRSLPSAAAVKVVNPELEVIAAGGDGDGFAIGMGHFPHTVRRNPNITYLVMDNEIYGLTKGQTSPTSHTGLVTKTTPWENADEPINPIMTALAHNCSFVARGISTDVKQLTQLLIEAMEHPGFSFVQAMSPCLTFHDTYEMVRNTSKDLPEDHDVTDRLGAIKYALDTDNMWTGVFYKVRRPTLDEVTTRNKLKALERNTKSPTPLMKIYADMGGKVPTSTS